MSASRLKLYVAAAEVVFLANQRLRYRRNIETALALNRRGEVRCDGLCLKNTSNRLAIEWVARDIHPWDRELPPEEKATLFVEQCLSDTEAALHRLFEQLASIDIIELTVLAPSHEHAIIAGTVIRSELYQLKSLSPGMRLNQLGLHYRLMGSHFEALDPHPDLNGTGRRVSKANDQKPILVFAAQKRLH
jgi:hypothetical protein